MVKIVA